MLSCLRTATPHAAPALALRALCCTACEPGYADAIAKPQKHSSKNESSKSKNNSKGSSANNSSSKKEKESFSKRADRFVRTFLKYNSYTSVALSSLLGAATARRAGMSPVGSVAMAVVAGMGGGTLRDLLLSRRAYWLKNHNFAWLCLGTGLMGAFFWDELKQRTGLRENGLWARLIQYGSLGGCTSSGAELAMRLNKTPLAQLVYGMGAAMVTATGGGMIRDYMLGRRPAVLYPEGLANVVPATVGAVVYQAAQHAGAPLSLRTALCFATAIPLRICMTRSYARKKALLDKQRQAQAKRWW